MYYALVCLMASNINFTEEIRMRLVNIAREMAQLKKNNKRIKEDGLEGHVRTDWTTTCLGSFAGIKFQAELDTELGTGKVAFLVEEKRLTSSDPIDTENSFWLSLPASPAKTRRTAQFN